MKNILKVCAILGILVSVVVALFHFHITSFSPAQLKEFLEKQGVLAPLLFLVLCSLRPIVLFPISIFFLVSGLLFGPLYGWLYNFIGACTSCTLAFFLARGLGREFAAKILGEKTRKIESAIEKEGFLIIFYTRFLIPFDILSYASGLSNVDFKVFAGATLLSIIPSSFVYSLIGNAVSNIKTVADFFTPQFMLPILLLLSVMILPLMIRRILVKKKAITENLEN